MGADRSAGGLGRQVETGKRGGHIQHRRVERRTLGPGGLLQRRGIDIGFRRSGYEVDNKDGSRKRDEE